MQSCATKNGEQLNNREIPWVLGGEDHSWLPYSAQNNLIFIGVSPRLTSRDESIKNALNDAARKLSIYYSVNASSESLQHLGAAALDVDFDKRYTLQFDDDLDKYLELLEYNLNTDVFENNNALFIMTRTYSDISMPAFRGHSISQIRPYWVESPPSQIDGFIVGVGFSGRLSSHRDTIVRSYEKAVVSIIERIETSVHGEHILYQTNDAFGFQAQSTSGTSASGTLENFYVIESWTDSSNLTVWTLAVAGRKL